MVEHSWTFLRPKHKLKLLVRNSSKKYWSSLRLCEAIFREVPMLLLTRGRDSLDPLIRPWQAQLIFPSELTKIPKFVNPSGNWQAGTSRGVKSRSESCLETQYLAVKTIRNDFPASIPRKFGFRSSRPSVIHWNPPNLGSQSILKGISNFASGFPITFPSWPEHYSCRWIFSFERRAIQRTSKNGRWVLRTENETQNLVGVHFPENNEKNCVIKNSRIFNL